MRETPGLLRACALMKKLSGLPCAGSAAPGYSLFHFGAEQGLHWEGSVSKEGRVSSRGHHREQGPDIPADVRERYSHIARVTAPLVIDAHNRWQQSVAEALESLSKSALEMFFGPLRYDQGSTPSDWRARVDPQDRGLISLDRIRVPRDPAWIAHWEGRGGFDWRCTLEEAITELWWCYQHQTDPPGYLWDVVGSQHDEPLWSWRWGGRNITTSSCPKERVAAREDAWIDFWSERRALTLET